MGGFFFLRPATFPSREMTFNLSTANRLKIPALFGSQATLSWTYYAPGIYPELWYWQSDFPWEGEGHTALLFLLQDTAHKATFCTSDSLWGSLVTCQCSHFHWPLPHNPHCLRSMHTTPIVCHSDSTPAISVLTPETSFNKGQTRVFQNYLEDFCRKSVGLASADTWLQAAPLFISRSHTSPHLLTPSSSACLLLWQVYT